MRTHKELVLERKIRVVSKFAGKTKFTFWTDVEIDDILIVRNKITRWGTKVEVENERTAIIFEIDRHRHLDNYISLWDDEKPIKWELE